MLYNFHKSFSKFIFILLPLMTLSFDLNASQFEDRDNVKQTTAADTNYAQEAPRRNWLSYVVPLVIFTVGAGTISYNAMNYNPWVRAVGFIALGVMGVYLYANRDIFTSRPART